MDIPCKHSVGMITFAKGHVISCSYNNGQGIACFHHAGLDGKFKWRDIFSYVTMDQGGELMPFILFRINRGLNPKEYLAVVRTALLSNKWPAWLVAIIHDLSHTGRVVVVE